MTPVATSAETGAPAGWKPKYVTSGREPKWDLAFLGVLAYVVIDYTRLPAMFPVLEAFQLGKVAVGLGLLGMFVSGRIRSKKRSETYPIEFALIGFVLAAGVSMLAAIELDSAWSAWVDLLRWAVLVFLLSRVVATRWRLRVFIILLILLNVKLAQFQLRDYQSEQAWGRDAAYMARGVGAGSTGWFANSNDFGIGMAVIWPLAALMAAAEKNKFWRMVLLVGWAIISGSILFSASRGALVGAGSAAIYMWLRNPKRLIGPLLIAALVCGSIFLLPEAHRQRILSAAHYENDVNAQLRFNLWKAGLHMFVTHPVFGVGINNFRASYALQYGESKGHVLVPHSIYIQALAETGLLGAIPVFLMFVFCVRLNSKTAKLLEGKDAAGKHQYEYYLALGLNCAWVAFLSNGAFLTVLYYPHAWMLTAMTIGLHTAVSNVAIENPVVAPSSGLKRPWMDALAGPTPGNSRLTTGEVR